MSDDGMRLCPCCEQADTLLPYSSAGPAVCIHCYWQEDPGSLVRPDEPTDINATPVNDVRRAMGLAPLHADVGKRAQPYPSREVLRGLLDSDLRARGYLECLEPPEWTRGDWGILGLAWQRSTGVLRHVIGLWYGYHADEVALGHRLEGGPRKTDFSAVNLDCGPLWDLTVDCRRSSDWQERLLERSVALAEWGDGALRSEDPR